MTSKRIFRCRSLCKRAAAEQDRATECNRVFLRGLYHRIRAPVANFPRIVRPRRWRRDSAPARRHEAVQLLRPVRDDDDACRRRALGQQQPLPIGRDGMLSSIPRKVVPVLIYDIMRRVAPLRHRADGCRDLCRGTRPDSWRGGARELLAGAARVYYGSRGHAERGVAVGWTPITMS